MNRDIIIFMGFTWKSTAGIVFLSKRGNHKFSNLLKTIPIKFEEKVSDRTQKEIDPQTLQKCPCFQIWNQGVDKIRQNKSATFLDKYPRTRPYVPCFRIGPVYGRLSPGSFDLQREWLWARIANAPIGCLKLA